METTARKLGLGAFACAIALLVAACLAAGTAHAATYTLTKSPANKYADAEQVFSVPLSKGGVKMSLEAGADDATMYLYPTADCSGSWLGYGYANMAYAKKTAYAGIAKSTTYYLKIRSGKPGAKVTITSYGTTGTLKSGKTITKSSCGDNNSVSYYKFKAKKRGYLNLAFYSLDGGDYGYYQIKVTNSKKKALTGDWTYISSSSPAKNIGVKKGTYYIAVKSSRQVYTLTPTFKKATKSVKTKRSKAKKIKKGKKVKAVLAAGEKAAWYKFKNTKKHKVKLSVTSKTFGSGIKVEVFDGKRSGGSFTFNSYRKSDTIQIYDLLSKKLSKGTYHIKVSSNNKGCGYYTLKWK